MHANRRRLLQGAVGAGLALGAGVSPRSRVGAAAELDQLRIATAALPPQLDPQTASWIVMQRVYPLLFDRLIRRDWAAGGALVPGLATEWTQVDDLTLEVSLRDDVVFHDGSPLAAADVKYTFDRSLAGDAKLEVTDIFRLERVDALDERTVRFVTREPSGSLLLQLTANNASIVPMAYHQEVGYEEFQQRPIGSGPYRLTEFVPDSHLAFERNEAYFDGMAAAKSVRIAGIPEVSTRIAALLNDEADLILDVPPDQVATIEANGGFRIDSTSPLNVNVLDIPAANAPMNSKQVRQAMSLAIDRQTIVEQLLMGNGLWPSGVQSIYDPLYRERPPLAFDPERARALLAEAGYAGEEIQFVFDSPDYYPLEQAWCEAIAAMWRDVGINVTMVGMDVGQRVEVSVPDSPYHVISDSSGVLADIEISQAFNSPTAYYINLHPPGTQDALMAAVQEAETIVDPEARADAYERVFDIMADEVPMIVLFTINRVSAMKEAITFAGSPDFGIDLRAGNFSVA